MMGSLVARRRFVGQEEALDHGASGGLARVEQDGADQRLDRVFRDLLVRVALQLLATPQADQGEHAEPLPHLAEVGLSDQHKALRGERPLAVFGVGLEEEAGHGVAQEGVAEELQALLVALVQREAAVLLLLEPGLVGERPQQQDPFAIGLGLDEDTAAFLGPDNVLEVVGAGAITVVGCSDLEHTTMARVSEGQTVQLVGVRWHVLAHGGTFRLDARKALPGEA